MLQAETLCGIRDGDGYCFGSPGNLQKQLMLLGLQPCADRRALAEVQKQTQLITEIGEYAKEGMIARSIATSTHIYIVPRYKYGAGEQNCRMNLTFSDSDSRHFLGISSCFFDHRWQALVRMGGRIR